MAINWSTVSATVTVDLVCDGHTVIMLGEDEVSRKPWSETYSFKNGVERYRVYEVSETHIRYRQAPQQPVHPDYAFLYESIELNIEIDRLSGVIKEIFTFKINKKLKDGLGQYRYQVNQGKCSTARKKF